MSLAFVLVVSTLSYSCQGQIQPPSDSNNNGNDVVKSPRPISTEQFRHMVDLDENLNYFLFWKYDEERITFEVHARTHGWVGLGFSTTGVMRGADIVVGWIKDGQATFKDYHGIDNIRPQEDVEQNYQLHEAMERDDFTILKFSREIETCDENDFFIDESTARVIFAWNDDDADFLYHGASHRGVKSVSLLERGVQERDLHDTEDTSTWKTFEMTQNKVIIPANKTYYHCRVMELPVLEKKHHIVQIDTLIEKENLGIVHHIVAYFCAGNWKQEEHGSVCWENEMPENATTCSKIAFAWAVGQGPFYLPKEAGMSIGDIGDSRYFKMEMHYDNPDLSTGYVDSSGFRIHYTDKLREHDVGIIMVGHAIWWPPLVIPPKADAFRLDSFCGGSCTGRKIPKEGIKVFSTFLHTHLAGRAIWTKHIRNGTELPEIIRDNNYDFNFQQAKSMKTPRVILPGDELITSCVYSTKDKTKPVYGGAGTEDEMCFNFLFYYPKIDLTACVSQTQAFYPIHQLVMHRAMTGKLHINPKEMDDKNTYDYLDELSWDKEDIDHMQRQIDHTVGYREYCVGTKSGEGIFGGGESTYEKVVSIREPFMKESKCLKRQQSETSKACQGRGYDVLLIVLSTIVTYLKVNTM